jgi:hypothetical protein
MTDTRTTTSPRRPSILDRIRAWYATDLQPHAHGDMVHSHVWGAQRHDHAGTRWGR